MPREDLPSIEDFTKDYSNLPSIEEFITEEVNTELPSVKDYLEEEIQTIEDVEENTLSEVGDIIPPFPELIRLINDVRKDIPDIPEIKYYDKELNNLTEQINQVREEILEVPEVRYYEAEIEAICEQIDLVKQVVEKNAAEIPEIKYYDDQINVLEERLAQVNQNIEELPEPKYYEEDLQSIRIAIQEVQDQIPTFPKWVNEVNEVPDFSWIGKTFSVIDDDFIKVHDAVEGLKGKVEFDLDQIAEHFDRKEFETRTSFNEFREDLNSRYDSEKERSDSEKERIWKEIKETSMRMWGHHKEFKDDDRKLKKQILGEYNLLKKSLKDQIEGVNQESVKTDELLLNYFNELKKEITELPEVKYYDEQIDKLDDEFKSLRTLVEEIKEKQEVLKEEVNNRPIQSDLSESNVDPLTPLDQNFATLDDLSSHYRLFLNRIQQQLATIGGGGETRLEFLDDLDRDTALVNGKFLKYQASTGTFVGADAGGGGALIDLTDVDTANLGDGRFLRYDAATEEFTFSPVSATNLELVAGDIQSGILTTTSTNTAVVMSISATTYRSVNYQVQVTRGTNYNMSTINVIHDGTTTYMTEYGTINQPVGVATFSSDISSGSLRLLGHPSSASGTTFKVVFTALEA